MPVRHAAVKLMRSYYLQHPQERASVDELAHAVVEPSLSGWSKAQNDIQTDVLAALTGSMSPLAAMRQAATQVDTDLSQS
jgi:LmbE family N-acetylglucosaminyl deacetylase